MSPLRWVVDLASLLYRLYRGPVAPAPTTLAEFDALYAGTAGLMRHDGVLLDDGRPVVTVETGFPPRDGHVERLDYLADATEAAGYVVLVRNRTHLRITTRRP